MELPLPAWFKYRQGVAEPAGDNCYKLTAPVSDTAFIRVRQHDGAWQAVIAAAPDGPELGASEPNLADEAAAWRAAFDLYKSTVIY